MGVNTAEKATGKGAKKTISGRPASGLSARRPVAKKSVILACVPVAYIIFIGGGAFWG